MKKALFILIPALCLLSCGGGAKSQDTPNENKAATAVEMLNIDQVFDLWPDQTLKCEEADVMGFIKAFNQALPTYSATTFLREAKLPEDKQEYLIEVDQVKDYVSFAEGSDDKDAESMEARVWNRNGGHKLFAICFDQPSSKQVTYVAFYDYDPSTQTLNANYDYLKYFKTSFDNAIVGISLSPENNGIVVQEYFMNWWRSIRHNYTWDGDGFSADKVTIDNMDELEALFTKEYEGMGSLPFTQYALLDIDDDGEPELWLSDDEEEDQAIYSIVEDKATLLAAGNYKHTLAFFKGVVSDGGGCGTGCYYSRYSIVEESQLKSTLVVLRSYNYETDDMDFSFDLDGEPISEDQGNEILESFEDGEEFTPDWRPFN